MSQAARKAPSKIPARDEVHSWLLEAFRYRIQQAVAGRPATDRLPAELIDRLEHMDRFVLKAESRSVQEEHFEALIDAGLQAEVYRNLNQQPWCEGHATLTDILKAHHYLTHLFGRRQRSSKGEEQTDRQLFFPADTFREFQRLTKTLVREDRVFISDRKLVKLYKLFRVRAWLLSGGTVSRDDLRLLAHLGETDQEIALLREKVPALLGA